MSEPFAIIVDGTAGVPRDLVSELGLHVLPLHVNFGRDSYPAGVDLTDAEFYARLKDGKSPPPTTSQPSIGEAREVFERVSLGAGGKVLVLTIATELWQWRRCCSSLRCDCAPACFRRAGTRNNAQATWPPS